jgi:hypothetical protein
MHILNHSFSKHGYSHDATEISYTLNKYIQLQDSQTMDTTFNNFNFFIFIEEENIPGDQTHINFAEYVQQISKFREMRNLSKIFVLEASVSNIF